MRVDTVVIGGGLSGLIAAIYVAQAGNSVRLIEKNEKLGGRASSTIIKGNVLNIGAHALYRSGQAMRIVQELGVPIAGKIAPISGIAVREGKMHSLPFQATSLWTSSLLPWKSKIKFMKFMLDFKKVKASQFRGMSWLDWVVDQFPNDRGAQQLMLALGRLWTYADVPEQCDAEAMIQQGQIGLDGVFYLHHGWQTLIDSLQQRAQVEGVTFNKANATSIMIHEDDSLGITLTNGEKLSASTVILAISPDEVLRLLDGSVRSSTKLHAWRHQLTPIYASCLDIALSQLPYSKRSYAMHLERPLYYSNHSSVARLSQEGNQVIHLLKYQANAEQIDPELDRKELEAWMSTLQPGWRHRVRVERYIPKVIVAHATPLVGKSSRPAPNDTGIDGLLIAGDWVGEQGMLADAATASAKQAAHEAIRLLRNSNKGAVKSNADGSALSNI